MSTDKGVISFQITYPTPDATDSIKERFHVVGVVEDLENIADRYLLAVPAHILTMVASAFYQQDQYRVELVEGLTSYKFYRRPSRELWPKEEFNTPLEQYQKANPNVKPSVVGGTICAGSNCPDAPRVNGITINYCTLCPNRRAKVVESTNDTGTDMVISPPRACTTGGETSCAYMTPKEGLCATCPNRLS